MVVGTVKSYDPAKGWGFIDFNGKDIFVLRHEFKGRVPETGETVNFVITNTEKGPQATKIRLADPTDDSYFFGEVKSFAHNTGYGFITCDAIQGQDIFASAKAFPVPDIVEKGAYCKFKIEIGEKGPIAQKIYMLGRLGKQTKEIMNMGGGGKGGKGNMMQMMMMMMKGKGKGKGGWNEVQKPQFQKKDW
mmetsp:Transcript_96805/g.177327  ORF Transcript_96805/g.177327 Transcript_96805/m.177327 type:complete len:190 (+) Transcript_96805:67-636(+)